MSVRIQYLKSRVTRVRHLWEKHERSCPCCHGAKSAAVLCSKGQALWLEHARKEIDLERAEAEGAGVSFALRVAGGVR